ncbi:hypothetical protein [Aeromicrobium panaciterrae]
MTDAISMPTELSTGFPPQQEEPMPGNTARGLMSWLDRCAETLGA